MKVSKSFFTILNMVKISNPHPKIEVYDDVFEGVGLNHVFKVAQMLPYNILGCCEGIPYMASLSLKELATKTELTDLTKSWLKNRNGGVKSGLSSEKMAIEHLRKTMPFQKIKKADIIELRVQIYTVGSFYPITEKNQYQKVLVHCLNTEWDPTWGGKMFFYDTSGNIVHAVNYKPNRAVLFDAELTYRCSTTNMKAPKFMYTLNTNFWKPRVNKKELPRTS